VIQPVWAWLADFFERRRQRGAGAAVAKSKNPTIQDGRISKNAGSLCEEKLRRSEPAMEAKRVCDIMTSEVTTLKRNEKLTLADNVMQLGRIRHLPVLDDEGKELVGIVSQRDLFRGALARALGYGQHASHKILDTLLVKDVMTTEVITTGPKTSLAEAAQVMMERKIGCLPVVQDGRLVGIITEADFVALVLRKN
jgi:CBS domain-containing protein